MQEFLLQNVVILPIFSLVFLVVGGVVTVVGQLVANQGRRVFLVLFGVLFLGATLYLNQFYLANGGDELSPRIAGIAYCVITNVIVGLSATIHLGLLILIRPK